MKSLVMVALIVVLSISSVSQATAAAAKPDLKIVAGAVKVPNPALPNMVSVELTVQNVGNAEARGFEVHWYPRAGSPALGCSISVPSLAVNAKGLARCSYSFSPGDQGAVLWEAVVDANYTVAESNENNNTYQGTVQLAGGQPPPGGVKPDLVLNQFVVAGNTFPDRPRKVKLFAEVLNDSDAQAGASTLRWYAKDAQGVVGWTVNVPKLDPHTKVSYEGHYTYPGDGPANWRAVVDADNRVSESNEDNNTRTSTWSASTTPITGQPDLRLTANVRSLDPVHPEVVSIGFTVINSGEIDTGPFTIRWYPRENFNVVGCTLTVGRTAANQTYGASCDDYVYSQRGEMHWKAVIDADDTIRESDEANNVLIGVLHILAPGQPTPTATPPPPPPNQPDLRIGPVFVEKNEMSHVSWVFMVTNGGGVASGPFLIELFPDTGLGTIPTVHFPSLASTQSQTYRLEFTYAASGPKHYRIVLDGPNEIRETDETNNAYEADFSVESGPGPLVGNEADVKFQSVQIEKNQQRQVTWSFTLRNQGATATGPFLIELFPDTGLGTIPTTHFPSIEPWQEQKYRLQFTYAAGGPKHYRIVLDGPNEVLEVNEQNNIYEGTVDVQAGAAPPPLPTPAPLPAAKPDLLVKSTEVDKSQSPVVNWHFTVRNNGAVASGPFTIELVPDTGLPPSASVQVPSLAPGQEGRYQLNNRYTTGGEKRWTIKADGPNQVQESNEGNNAASGTVSIRSPRRRPRPRPRASPTW